MSIMAGRPRALDARAIASSGLVAEVGLGRVGIVVSVLARGNADWYGLLDLCD
jgi:hypothetical protein